MRRRVSLYIVDRPVDLDDESFILFNWAQEDLSNPTIVKNSYTQQITLKGTPGNNAIFGDYFRVDRRFYDTTAPTGVGFNPSARTPFTLYNELNEVLQSGYVKLDQVSVSGRDIQYQVTLYGGLGSFFYALSYDDEGNKRTLADLDYLGTSDPDTELDFLINADAVKAAWATIADAGDIDSMWKVINFAPCYNGIPEDFSADKGLVVPSDVGLSDARGDAGNVTYGLRSGYALVNMANKQDEWAVKDLRSYLQRPVFSMRAFLSAVCNPANNGGYSVDISDIESADFPYRRLWMTLPMLTDQTPESLTIDIGLSSLASSWGTSDELGEYSITMSGQAPSNATVTANVHFRLKIDANIGDNYVSRLWTQILRDRSTHQDTAIFIQAVAYDGAEPVGGSKVACISTVSNADGYLTPESVAGIAGYSPGYAGDDIYEEATRQSIFSRGTDGYYLQDDGVSLEVTCSPADRIVIEMSSYFIYGTSYSDYHVQRSGYPITLDSPDSPTVNNYDGVRGMSVSGSGQDSIQIEIGETIRTNARITKSMLLSTEHSPADYLLSFCKIFGLKFLYDNYEKKVTILRRDTFYEDETVDLSGRVDVGSGITIRPIVYDAKWYEFLLESDGGKEYDTYKTLYGQDYGMQRVNTGYDFDANTTNLMDGNVFRSAACVLESSKYMNYIFVDGKFRPSPFVDKGNTYSLWSSDGDTAEFGITSPPFDAEVNYYNNANHGYDIPTAAKLQLHDSDGKTLDGSGILLMRNGSARYPYFKVTDDIPAMSVLNDGEPCWILTPGTQVGVIIHTYARYVYGSDLVVDHSLDFGLPRELYIPGLSYDADKAIYVRAWQKYLADRYDVNTKVMTCKVDFRGMQVGQELLRRFYWYDGSIWVINSISNYSMTTWDLAEVELVQVQDKDNYLEGQYNKR